MYSRKPNSVNKMYGKNQTGESEYYTGRRGTVQLGQNSFGQNNIPNSKKNIDENNQTNNSKCKF